ncbi:MAG: C25 family cysteine peptidase [Candidatus Cloacimonetes bacterium]|nr:C25 family cysteine peptidase [Candidatus Cloacimonadota bacterium]
MDSPIKLVSQQSGRIQLRLDTPKLELERFNNSNYQSLKMEGSNPMAEAGLPELPMFTTWVAIPATGDFSIRVDSGNYKVKNNVLPKPVFTSEDQERLLENNAAAYNSSSLYPSTNFAHSSAQIIRDFRVVQISLFPVQFDGATQSLRICDNMSVEILMNTSTGDNELPSFSGYSPAFTELYESMICNFDSYRDPLMAPASPRILIIYGNNPDAIFISKLNEFTTWKRQKGFEVNLASTAVAGNSTTNIKSYIQAQYNNINTRPDFIILLGDADGNYSIPAFVENLSGYGGEGDYPYTHLSGSDLLGDAFIGRISVSNVSQLDVMLSKIYAYEKNINISGTSASWLNRMLLIGDPSSSGVSTKYVNMFIKEMAKTYNPDYSFIENYEGGFSSTINSGINQGVGFYNYRGYYNMSGWTPSSSLVNGTKLSHATILTCATGDYYNDTSTTEALVRLGTSASPAGSVTAIGMATTGTHTMFNNTLVAGIYDGIFTHRMRTMGEALLNGRLYIKQIYGATHDAQSGWFAHWCNLIGDPTVEVWTGIPKQLTLTAPNTVAIGTSLLDCSVMDSEGNPLPSITVTAFSNSLQSVIAKGFTDEFGNVSLMVTGGLQNDIVITASAHNHKPVQQPVSVDGNGSIVFVDKEIVDDGTSGSSGNGDGFANAGETIAVKMEIKNTTANSVTGLSATISTNDPYISIISAQSTFSAVASSATAISESYFTFSINTNLPPNHDIRLEVQLVDGNQINYPLTFHVSSYNAKLLVNNHTITGGGNSILDPAEEGFLQVAIKNNSVFGIEDVYAELRSLNDLLVVNDSTSFIGSIPAGMITTSVDGFEVFARALIIPGMQMPMRLRLFNDSGFEQFAEFNIPIGQVSMNTPLGPDAYGYFIYDITDTAYTDCPTYDWVEINPSQGGSGTLISGFNDTGDEYGDEGDQNGSVTLKVLDLPFSFPFYGITYNQITVCVNGFIAMGVTGNGEFRNYRLPGGYGPSPMIAAFWDDLILIADAGIYKYYNASNHTYIIQYHKLRNGYNRTSVETFQVIFYDPIFYPTSLGDGMIKIQYKDFNNVDVGGSGGYSPLHGNFSTIGIKDHTNTVGLEYSYNNQYPYAAAPLANGKALLITTAPVLHENAFLVIDNMIVSDPNNNGVAEPGETLDIGIKLINIGLDTATEVHLTASTSSTYATLVSSSSNYANIAGDSYAVNQTPLQLQIDLDCPNGAVIPLNCIVTIAGNSWQYPLNITVYKPAIEISGVYVNDSAANGNGLIDAGETVLLIVNFNNSSTLEAKNITSNINCMSEFVTISNPSILIPGIPSGSTCQAVYQITVSPEVVVGNYLTFYLTYLGDLIDPQNEQIVASVGTTGMNEDFETDNGNFIASPTYNGWEWGTSTVAGAHSGVKIWGTRLNSQYPANVTYTLTTPNVFIGTNFMLEFWHSYDTEVGYDGGNVKISTNNGSSWTVIHPEGGYTSNNLSILEGPGYDGNSNGWVLARFNLATYANQNVLFRFTFSSDGLYEGDGWFIDDVRTSGFIESAGKVSGTVSSSNTSIDFSKVMVQNALNWGTHPNSEGDYSLFLPMGNHQISAISDGYYSEAPSSIVLSLSNQTTDHDFYLGYLAPVTNLSYQSGEGNLNLSWVAAAEPEYPITGYKVFRKINAGAFEQAAFVSEPFYTEVLGIMGTSYHYNIVCCYAQGNSLPSDDLYFHYTTANEDEIDTPTVTKLMNNYPNPFNPETTFRFSLKESARARLSVYNVKGQLVKKIVDEVLPSGIHQIVWNGRDFNNSPVSSGIYFYRLESKEYSATKRAVLLK